MSSAFVNFVIGRRRAYASCWRSSLSFRPKAPEKTTDGSSAACLRFASFAFSSSARFACLASFCRFCSSRAASSRSHSRAPSPTVMHRALTLMVVDPSLRELAVRLGRARDFTKALFKL